MSIATYTIRIEDDPLDGGFIGHVVELPGILSQGETAPDAIVATAEALAAELETWAHSGPATT
ncbi:MAG TPA: type II toxin-antitoxin system HicB family antitoxin [Jatrophihabitantaceae bacterium]|jgi:predicted RNase H-like HicB family nuclease